MRGDVNQLGRVERLGHFQRHRVGIDPIGLAVAVKPQRRHDRHDALRQQALQHLHVDALDLAGEKMVLAVNDAQRMGDERVARGGAQIVGAEALQNLMRQPVGGGQRQLERRGVGDAARRPDWKAGCFVRGPALSICAAAPCTSTTRMLNERSTATSRRMLAKFSLVTIAPSMLMTKIFSRKRGIYCRMPRRSVSFTF